MTPLRYGCAPGTKHSTLPFYKALARWFSVKTSSIAGSGVKAQRMRGARFPLHRFLLSTGALVAISVTTAPGLLSAKDPYAGNPARGLAIYKPSSFASDSTARVTEYMSYKSHDTVTYLITPDGGRLTVPTETADLIILPYPGRGELQPEAALGIISVAESRFPQYRPVIDPLKAAWVEESKRPRAEIAGEIRKRQQNQSIAQKAAELWNSVTKPARKPTASPTASATPVQSGDTDLKPKPAELEKNLKTIEEYYHTLDKVGNETNR